MNQLQEDLFSLFHLEVQRHTFFIPVQSKKIGAVMFSNRSHFPQIISSNCIRSAGLKKWSPIILPESFRTEAISVMGRADVFEANMTSGRQISSSFLAMPITVIFPVSPSFARLLSAELSCPFPPSTMCAKE
jgi:hypothetical protein